MRKSEKLNTSACVITIPAHFSIMQAEAIKRAGLLAGFKYVVLLQEPIAAAISYGFGKNKNENWLVYDLGGGTFDVALISSKDGNLKVLGHNGDNFLGGKDIDAKIVEDVIVPNLKRKYYLTNFDTSNSNYSVYFAKLKYAAEQAKIQLSSLNEVNIEVDINIDGEEIYENILLTRENLEQILGDMLNKTINLCKQTIEEACIKSDGVNKIILVGNPTQLPFIKSRLKNTSDEYFFQIQSSDNTFNTGKKLIKDGKIVANVTVKPNKFNSYWFYLFDKDGNTLNSSVDEFSITHGLLISGAPYCIQSELE